MHALVVYQIRFHGEVDLYMVEFFISAFLGVGSNFRHPLKNYHWPKLEPTPIFE
ncbi:hypothetical protein MTBBW1_1880034 [Desulfamplus magnetovallimortis]|uniref:Uncharacterized protein n=1 Tax=Desulfamplus magnetovallimortis TaxID=1246637 RepID=A0A1W1HAU1_9BACT|nr:hypothetical protein MTBBW1_1880034 [Desulfamplus magnetovallimortis]